MAINEEERIRERSGLDGGRITLRDAQGQIIGYIIEDPDDSANVITVDADGWQTISVSESNGSEYNGPDKAWRDFVGDWKFAKE